MSHADRMTISDADRAHEVTGIIDPMSTRHLTIAVQVKVPSPYRQILFATTTGKNRGDTGQYRPLANLEFTTAFIQRAEAHFNTGHIRNRIVAPWRAHKRKPEITRPWFAHYSFLRFQPLR